tara:strand:+ start:968 stop:1912 length:945 start_codon:yes stop_codon:yes gene_type:complete
MTVNIYDDGKPFVVSEILAQEYHQALADRVGGFYRHPAVINAGTAVGSAVTKVDFVDTGSMVLASTAENTAVTATQIATTRASVTLSMHRAARSVGDLLSALSENGDIRDPAMFAMDAAQCYEKTVAKVLIDAAGSFTNSVGSTGADLTWQTFRQAAASLYENNTEFVDGSILAVLHPHQWADLQNDAASASIGDAVARSPEAQAALGANGPLSGFRGRYFGVDIYTSGQIPLSGDGADRLGWMIGKGALVWASGNLAGQMNGGNPTFTLDDGRLQVEMERDASVGMLNVYYNSILGGSVAQQGAACVITSGAS